jgi:L-threonylcarbamoyladenylate synthase
MIVPADDTNIAAAAHILCSGGVVAFPTETVYGLGADAFNTAAVARVFQIKNRPHFDPLIVHIADLDTLNKVVSLEHLTDIQKEYVYKLIRMFWPGPLTFVLPKNAQVPGLVTAGMDTVAVRLPKNEAAIKLIRLGPGAVAAPSANPFGYLSPTRAEHVEEHFSGLVDCILDGGSTEVGLESTVLDLCGAAPRILRHGGIPAEALEAITGKLRHGGGSGADVGEDGGGSGGMAAEKSPGLLKSHYAPRAPLFLYEQSDMQNLVFNARDVYLFYSLQNMRRFIDKNSIHKEAARRIFWLCDSGGAPEAAARLFETLHIIDSLHPAAIHAEKAPPDGMGAAINDRLFRSAGSPQPAATEVPAPPA